MNFWRSFGFYTPSPIDNILEKDSFELEELLDEDDIIHELRVLNKNLLAYLVGPAVLEKVVRYVVTNGQVEVDGQLLPEAKQKKYVNVCTEILALDAFTIADAVCQNEQLIDNLYGFLEGTPPLKPHTAAHGSRILTALLNQRPKTIVEFLQRKASTVPNLIRHIGSSPVMEFLLRIIQSDESARGAGVEGGTLRWLLNANLLSSIVALLGPENKESVQENAAEALIMILNISDNKSPLISKLHSNEVVTELFQRTMSESSVTSSSLRNGLTVISELIAHLSDVFMISDDDQLPPVLVCLEQHLDALKSLLESRSGHVMATSFGQVDSPFGPTRLKILELIASVVTSKYEGFIYRIMIDQRLFVTCMNLFFTYEWNSILHKTFFDIVKSILDGSDLSLKTALFEECNFHTQIAIHSIPTAGSLRKGFMGYVYQIATSIERDAEEVSAIAERLESSEEWKRFVELELAPTRRIIDPSSVPAATATTPVLPTATTTTDLEAGMVGIGGDSSDSSESSGSADEEHHVESETTMEVAEAEADITREEIAECEFTTTTTPTTVQEDSVVVVVESGESEGSAPAPAAAVVAEAVEEAAAQMEQEGEKETKTTE